MTAATSSSNPTRLAGETSLLELLNALLRRWRIVVGIPVAAAVAVAVASFLVPATYTATTTFVPEARPQTRLPAGLAGLAGQFGLSIGGEASESPRFYADLVKSRELLERVLLTHYADPSSPGDSVTLLTILDEGGRDLADSLYRGVKALDELISVRVYSQTNIVRLNVDARDAGVAGAVANRFVGYLNDFNAQTRQSRARERRKFIELRLTDGESELRNAETGLRVFYERNRSWQQAPQLVFEEGRLRRQVDIRQEVYLTLRREYETARIEEVNDTPVITIIDRATPPTKRSKPRRSLLIVLSLMLGGIVGVTWAVVAAYFDRVRREDQPDYREFRSLLHRVGSDISGSGGGARRSSGRDAEHRDH